MADEEKEVVTVENKGGKGNPHHAPKGAPGGTGGQFTSSDGVDTGEKESLNKTSFEDDDFGVIKIQAAPRSSIGNKFFDFLSKKKEEKDREALDFIQSIESDIDEEHKKFYNSLSREEKLKLLYDSPIGYDKKKLKFATDNQLTALLLTEAIKNKRIQIEQQIELLSKRKQEIDEDIKNTLSQNNIDGISGVWAYATKYPSDWKELKDSGSIDKKREFYNQIINNSESSISDKFKAQQFLKKLDSFEQAGQDYENLKTEYSLKYIDDLEEIELKTNELIEQSHKFEKDTPLLQAVEEYSNNFVDFESTYSKERKNKAIWFKDFSASYNHFSGNSSKHWTNMSSEERAVIKAYTGSGYSRFNKPLRGIKQDPDGYSFGEYGLETFSKGVNNLTNAIDKCTWDEDIWVNRYINNHTKMFRLPGTTLARTLESMSEQELQSLVGTSFTDGGFFSAGAAKGTGYHTGSIVFNVYCPKGTHMAYVAPYSATGKGENEMILQRGYSYRITKVEKKGGSYFLDMEVILGSDANKPIGNDLKKIGNEFYYKPRFEKGEDYD